MVQKENKLLSLRVSHLSSVKAVSKIKQIEYQIYWLHHLNWFFISFQIEENGLEHLPKYEQQLYSLRCQPLFPLPDSYASLFQFYFSNAALQTIPIFMPSQAMHCF